VNKRRAAIGLALALPLVGLLVLKLAYGGGESFPHVGTEPVLPASAVRAIELPLPPGCVAVSAEGRVFFDTHPFAAPGRLGVPKLFELVDGTPRPWPSEAAQDLLVAPFGITTDGHGRLWLTEPATLDRSATRLLAFDLATGELAFEHVLPDGVARFAQDLRVSPDGRQVVLADTGAFAFTDGQLVVFDVAARAVVRTLKDERLNRQPYVIRRFDGETHAIAYGLITFQVGVDGITFSPDGRSLYFATMSHDTLYRVPADLLLDPAASDERVRGAIEAVGRKPQSDGIAAAADGRIIVTAVEDGGLVEVSPDGKLRTLTASPDVKWADGVAIGPNGTVWFTDSAIPAYLQPLLTPPSGEVLRDAGPYHLYAFELPPPALR
jgi:sugar lactone lactonase YvrE